MTHSDMQNQGQIRIKQNADHKQAAVNPQKETITMRKGKNYTAAAVAAALVVLNLGGGYMLMNMKNPKQGDMMQNVGYSEGSDSQEFDITEQIIEESAEDTTETVPEVEQDDVLNDGSQEYVKYMQMYYENMTNAPCTYDFTGLGKDFNAEWEDDSFKVKFHGVTGCDWIMYYFYDVEKKNIDDEDAVFGSIHVAARLWNTDHSDYVESNISMGYIQPLGLHYDTQNDGYVHLYGTLYNTSGVPYFHSGDTKWSQLQFVVKVGDDAEYPLFETPLDFVEQEFPLHEAAQPSYVSRFSEPGFTGLYYVLPKWLEKTAEKPLCRCAETPFGIYYLSDQFQADGTTAGPCWNSLLGIDYIEDDTLPEEDRLVNHGNMPAIRSYVPYYQKNADGEIIRELKFSWDAFLATEIPYDNPTVGHSCLFAAINQPVDLNAGTLVLADE